MSNRTLKKYPLETDEDVRKIFNYPYFTHDNTISNIKNHGRVMFIIRGPPYTRKTKLSDLLRATYPEFSYCSSVKHLEEFDDKDDASRIDPEIVKCTVDLCRKLVEEACCSKQPTIIVQNSHMRKLEMMEYVRLAIQYDYIVIMACTMYKFDITVETFADYLLSRKDPLDIRYLKRRLREWEDVPPIFTAWFISQDDSEYIRSRTFEKLKTLTKVKLFRSWLGTDDVASYFQPRANMCCLAGYSTDANAMKKYYFSKDVQKAYGRCFPIVILGYLITRSDIIGVAQLNGNMKSLVMDNSAKSNGNTANETPISILQYGKTTEFSPKKNLPSKSSDIRKKWLKKEKVPVEMCRPFHIAQRGFDVFSMDKVSEQFEKGLQLMSNRDGILNERYFELRNGAPSLYKLNEDVWFVSVTEKFLFSTIFTGFYV